LCQFLLERVDQRCPLGIVVFQSGHVDSEVAGGCDEGLGSVVAVYWEESSVRGEEHRET
jgi:hypothetical protein